MGSTYEDFYYNACRERDALRAEVERLREAAKIADEMYEQAATQANDYAAQRLETIANCERLVEQFKAEVERLRLLLTKSRTLLLDAVMHGMPITDDVLEIRNWMPLPAPPAKEE